MLATGPWYTSATTIGWTAVVVAVVFGVVTIVLWRLGIPKRLLIYTAESTSLLLTSGLKYNNGDDIKVIIKRRVVADPHLVTLTIASRSRRDIRASEFDKDRPLLFHLGVPIVAAKCIPLEKQNTSELGSDLIASNAEGMPSQTIQIQPSLIRRGPWRQVHLLTDGLPDLTFESPIADVTVRKGSHAESRLIYVAIGILAGCLLFVGGVIANPHPRWPEVVIAVALMLVAIGIGGELVTAWHRRPS